MTVFHEYASEAPRSVRYFTCKIWTSGICCGVSEVSGNYSGPSAHNVLHYQLHATLSFRVYCAKFETNAHFEFRSSPFPPFYSFYPLSIHLPSWLPTFFPPFIHPSSLYSSSFLSPFLLGFHPFLFLPPPLLPSCISFLNNKLCRNVPNHFLLSHNSFDPSLYSSASRCTLVDHARLYTPLPDLLGAHSVRLSTAPGTLLTSHHILHLLNFFIPLSVSPSSYLLPSLPVPFLSIKHLTFQECYI